MSYQDKGMSPAYHETLIECLLRTSFVFSLFLFYLFKTRLAMGASKTHIYKQKLVSVGINSLGLQSRRSKILISKISEGDMIRDAGNFFQYFTHRKCTSPSPKMVRFMQYSVGLSSQHSLGWAEEEIRRA